MLKVEKIQPGSRFKIYLFIDDHAAESRIYNQYIFDNSNDCFQLGSVNDWDMDISNEFSEQLTALDVKNFKGTYNFQDIP